LVMLGFGVVDVDGIGIQYDAQTRPKDSSVS